MVQSLDQRLSRLVRAAIVMAPEKTAATRSGCFREAITCGTSIGEISLAYRKT